MYIAERVDLDRRALTLKKSTEEATRVGEQLILIKRKLSALSENVLDTIKAGLQAKLDEEDEKNLPLYGFPTDDPALTVYEMHQITAVLLEANNPPAHCKVS